MNRILAFCGLLMLCLAMSSCNTGEGRGGTCTLEGNVWKVLHPDDVYDLGTDTIPGAKTDVFIVYGNDDFYGDDVETDMSGHYRIKYLRPGTYTVYAYSSLASGEKVAVSQTVSVKSGQVVQAPDIYIHDGKAYGTSMVKGVVMATYINNNGNVIGWGPAYEHRLYIQRAGDCFQFDDVRAGLDGVFMFQKLQPGDYIVYTFSEDEIPSVVSKTITVHEANQIYTFPDTFRVTINP